MKRRAVDFWGVVLLPNSDVHSSINSIQLILYVFSSNLFSWKVQCTAVEDIHMLACPAFLSKSRILVNIITVTFTCQFQVLTLVITTRAVCNNTNFSKQINTSIVLKCERRPVFSQTLSFFISHTATSVPFHESQRHHDCLCILLSESAWCYLYLYKTSKILTTLRGPGEWPELWDAGTRTVAWVWLLKFCNHSLD